MGSEKPFTEVCVGRKLWVIGWPPSQVEQVLLDPIRRFKRLPRLHGRGVVFVDVEAVDWFRGVDR